MRNNRYLEEDKKIPATCKIKESVNRTSNNINLVEYECLGNTTEEEDNLTNYNLNNIEESNNTGLIEKSNLDEIISNTEVDKLKDKQNSSYTTEDLLKITIFEMNDIKNKTSDNYQFNFTLDGKIDKQLKPRIIDAKIKLVEIENKEADCKFNIKEDKKADLNCQINVEDYKEYKILSFKISEIGDEENPIYLSRINEVKLINEEKKEEENENENEKNNSNYLKIIIIICVIILIVSIIIIAICIKRLISRRTIKIKEKSNKVTEKKIKDITNNENSTNRKVAKNN